jgi:sugar phosphate isomerase/epimerase
MKAEPAMKQNCVDYAVNDGRSLVSLKGRLPFLLGTTSYIIPADILPNLHHLQNRVDDVELLLFESDEFSNMPSPEEVAQMASLKKGTGLSYTVHLPLDTRLGSRDEAERVASVGKCLRAIEIMSPTDPFAWILHLHGDRRGDPPTDDLDRWNHQNRRSLTELLAQGPDPRRVCVETLDYDFELVADLIEAFDLSVCLDIGHLLVAHRDVDGYLARWLDRTRVFHIHGVDPSGKDHCDLGHFPERLLRRLASLPAPLLSSQRRVVTMEVFGEQDFERSMQVVAKAVVQRQEE